jgi:quercetin dioxygenase-like cupin family protein
MCSININLEVLNMAVFHERDFKGIELQGEGIKDVVKKSLVSPKEGWKGQVMRVFEIGEGGHTPKHAHPWYHVNYILEGKGTLYFDGAEYEVEAGSYAYVPENVIHQFSNTGKGKLRFACIVPEEGDV